MDANSQYLIRIQFDVFRHVFRKICENFSKKCRFSNVTSHHFWLKKLAMLQNSQMHSFKVKTKKNAFRCKPQRSTSYQCQILFFLPQSPNANFFLLEDKCLDNPKFLFYRKRKYVAKRYISNTRTKYKKSLFSVPAVQQPPPPKNS